MPEENKQEAASAAAAGTEVAQGDAQNNNPAPAPKTGEAAQAAGGVISGADNKDDNPAGGADDNPKVGVGDGKNQKPAGAPEAYKDFELPDGISIDKEASDEFTALARADNLTQEQAQKYINLQAKLIQKGLSDYQKTAEGWQKESKEFLGADDKGNLTPEGAKKAALIKNAVIKAGGQKALDALVMTGAENHPDIIKALLSMAQAFTEDDLNIDGEPPTPKISDGDRFYGKNKNK